ncbi:hypothetical protein D7D52_10305 [Nocardia yunnanensis]|uniref:DUF6879 domain-containing protein n=2 Tax=Nocardia yunnanensis TaxID=2382165 RepID=A0A386Z966_9NOCA|nr:hypothetical protein D7D52_10305 [Nocardia yunnanensis]
MGFDDLVAEFRGHKRAFHLEVRDDYTGVPGEADALERFAAGRPLEPAFTAQWYTLVREVTASGTSVQRVRVVTEPHTDYVRFAVATTPGNLDAGEDIRWLPREVAPEELPDDDWWLLDEDLVAWTVFEQDGTALPGWVATTDSALTAHYAAVRDRLWDKAIRHHDYIK